MWATRVHRRAFGVLDRRAHARRSIPPPLFSLTDNVRAMALATATLPTFLRSDPTRFQFSNLQLVPRRRVGLRLSYLYRPNFPTRRPLSFSLSRKSNRSSTAEAAYVTGPASDPIFSELNPKFDTSSDGEPVPRNVIGWGLLCHLLLKHKFRLSVAALTLIGCSACTLSMPIFSGQWKTHRNQKQID